MVDGSLIFDTQIDTSGVTNAKKVIEKSTTTLGNAFKKLGKLALTAFSVKAIINFSKQALEAASDLQEVQNVVDVAFGSMSDTVDKWAKTTVEKFGMSELKAKQFASTYAAMGKGIGLESENAAAMAIGATERIGDIASFYNKSFEEVDTMMKSIWTGETESLKRIGVVMTETNLKAFALSQGITQNYKDMDQATKTQLRYAYVMQQTALAQGDFMRTSDSWANQTRILSEQFNQLKISIGTGLIQALTPALKIINALMTKINQLAAKFSEFTAYLFGKQSLGDAASETAAATEDISSGIYGAADAEKALGNEIDKTTKKQQKQLMGFDQLNRLGSDDDTGGSGASVGDISGLENVEAITGSITDNINEGVNEAFENLKEKIAKMLEYGLLLFGIALLMIGIFTFSIPKIIAGCVILGFALTMADSDITQPSWVDEVISWGLMIIGVALLLVGMCTGNLALVVAGGIALMVGYAWGDASGALKEPSWVSTVCSWGLLIVGTALLLVGICTVNFPLIAAGFIALALGYSIGKESGALNKAPKWVGQVVSWGLAIIGTALMLIGIFTVDFFLLAAGFAALAVAFKVGDTTGAFKSAPAWVNQIITWGLSISGVAMVLVGFATVNIPLIVAGFALIGVGIAYGIKSDAFKNLWTAVKNLCSKIWSILTEFWNTKMKKIFTKEYWKQKWDTVISSIKGFINTGIGYFERFVNWVITGVNKLIGAVNKIKIDVPEWLQGITGASSIGFNLKTVEKVTLPRLASGTVIPANYGEFAAILGDNKRETEVVSPLSTIEQAVENALKGMSFTIEPSDIYMDGDKVGKVVFKVHNNTVARTGRTPLKGVNK